MTQPKTKPDGWEEQVEGCIREGLNFKATNETLVEKLGEKAGISGAAYQRHKKKITGGKAVDKNLEEIGEKVKGAKEEVKSQPRPAWNKTKQNAADTSKLAELLNKGIYSGVMPFCASKQLKQSDVLEINPGGAIVGVIQWGFPGINLEHPIVIVLTRGIMFFLKFRQVCRIVKEKMAGGEGIRETIGGIKGGLKPEFEETLK